MSRDLFVTILTWAAGLSALVAVAVYFLVLARRPGWVRLLNGSGLFFTGAALAQIAVVLPRAAEVGGLWAVAVTMALLIAAVLAQSSAAIRNRQAWDGVERRANGGGEAPKA